MDGEAICILLIEDDPGDARLLQELLAEAGSARFNYTVANRLATGLERLIDGNFDVVLLDLSLPDSQGVETLRRLRANAPGLPVVVLTGLEDETLGVTLVQTGAQDYLVKGQVTTGHLLLRSVRYAIERQRAEAEIIQRNRELLALQRAGATIVSSLDLANVLSTVTREMASLLEVEGCAIYEWHETDGTISKLAEFGPASWKVQRVEAQLYHLAELPLTRRVLFERRPQQMILSQPELDPSELAYLQGIRLKTRLMVPLEFKDRVIGLAEIKDSQDERTFTDQEISLVQLLANQAASAIENARLHTETDRRARQLAVLHELDRAISASLRLDEVYNALAHHTTRLLAYDRMSIVLLEEEGLRVAYTTPQDKMGLPVGMLLPLKGSATGWVAAGGQPLLRHRIAADLHFTEDEQLVAGGIQSAMLIPLRIKGHTIGTWNLGSRRIGNYGPDDLEIAQAMASQLVIVIENARLYEQARQEIAERQRMEAVVREREKHFRSLIEKSSDAIALFDAAGVIRYASPSTRQILGYDLEDFVGRSGLDLLHPDDLERARAFLVELAQKPGGTASLQYRMRHKDGSWRWLEGVGTNLLDEPSVQAIVSNYRDVTERRKLEEQLQQSQKMEAVGRLAGGIAHDFNNLLLVITGYSELLLHRYLGDDARQRGYVEEINRAGAQAASLTRQLLAFSRKQVLEPRVLDLNEVIAETDKMLRRLIGEDIDLVTLPRAELGRVKADPGQIEQIVMNLAINARDAMSQGGKLTIETANVELDEVYARQHAEVTPGPYVLLAVSDTGIGMDQETLSHIFEPFFTTKEPGKGTGLGLATVYGIVKQSGGHIWVYSEVGRGATFKIYLPRVEEAGQAVAPGPVKAALSPGSETILLVEDSDAARGMISTLLREEGYVVLEARSGAEALQVYAQHTGPFHLLVTDIVMPGGLNGRELAERLTSLYPGLKVLFMSGYTDEAIVHHGVLNRGVAFIQKPFTPMALTRKVREVLDAPLSERGYAQ